MVHLKKRFSFPNSNFPACRGDGYIGVGQKRALMWSNLTNLAGNLKGAMDALENDLDQVRPFVSALY